MPLLVLVLLVLAVFIGARLLSARSGNRGLNRGAIRRWLWRRHWL